MNGGDDVESIEKEKKGGAPGNMSKTLICIFS
jgi:hypothetical protein